MKDNYYVLHENTKSAEVFTPVDLVNEMLDKLPEEVWKASDTTFCDPCFGSGTFIIEIIKRLRKYGHSVENISSRIWGYEINHKWVNRLKKLLNFSSYNIKIKCVNTLKENDMPKFDVVVGNPPYQEVKKGKRSAQNCNLWSEFIIMSYEKLTKKYGYVALVSPLSWRAGTNKLKKYFFANDLIFVDFDAGRFFKHIGGFFGDHIGAFVGQNAETDEITTEILSKGKIMNINFKNLEILPNVVSELDLSIMNKTILSDKYISIKMYNEKIPKHELNLEKNEIYNTEYFSSSTTSYWGKSKDKIYDIPKIIFSRSASFKPYYSNNMTVTYNGECILFDDENTALNALSIINSTLHKYLQNRYKYSGFMSGFMYNKIMVMSDLSRKWTDEELYEYFNLTKEEIKYIESQVK